VRRPDNQEKARERIKKREKYAPLRIYGEPDNVLYMDDIPDGYTDMFQVMQGRVPGVSVDGSTVHIRGISSMFGSNDPLYLVDGVPVDAATFGSLNPKDVEIVEFLKGPSASIFGNRGSNGVIAAYTKRGDYMRRGYFDFKMLAYYAPREFYATPVLMGKTSPPVQKPETIYWKPEIKIGSAGEGLISFKMNEKAKLRIVVEGISVDGTPCYIKKIISL
jgi:hypothetical protein